MTSAGCPSKHGFFVFNSQGIKFYPSYLSFVRLPSLHTRNNTFIRPNPLVLPDGKVDMTPIVGVAARHGVLLWEDCAQVFTGLGGYLGHPKSDAAFFSFGVIKRATALGGGVARIRDAAVLSGMLHAGHTARDFKFCYSTRSIFCLAESATVTSCVANEWASWVYQPVWRKQ